MNKRIASFVIALFLAVTCIVVPLPVKASNGSIDFDDLINAGKKVPEITLYADKTAAAPGETVQVTVSVTGGETAFTEITFVPLEDTAYEVVDGSVIGIGLEGASGSFDKATGGKVTFADSAVKTGDIFRYTIKISAEATGTVILDGDALVKDGATELPCLLVDTQVSVTHVHSFTNYVSDNNATTEKDGTKTAVCDHAGCDETDTIPDPGSKLEGKNGWVEESGKWYYYENNVKKTGWVKDNEAWYYMDANGVMVTGWLQEGSTWYYLKSSGAMVTGEYTIDGALHNFAGNGVWLGRVQQTAKNGWVQESGKWYYYKNGTKQTGWIQPNNTTWYYLDTNGVMVTGEYTISGKLHKFNDSGAWLGEVQQTAKNGWVQESGKWYYYKNGTKQTGWIQPNNTTWYYLDTNGVMVTGEYTISGKLHKFNDSGAWLGEVQQTAKNGWVQESGKWYYYQNGAKKTGWMQDGTTWYYMDANGVMQTGWLKSGNTWYYLRSSGAMATGWVQDGTTWYYMNASGAMQTGWLKLGNTWYYLQTSGAMVTGSLKIGDKTYNFNSSGACLNP